MNAEDILAAALERKLPSARAAYLDQACGADQALRAQVEGLLNAHEAAGSFLEQPLFRSTPTVDEPTTERPGTVIGPYKLLEQIGEGGMGVVFMAEQQAPIRRRVALKVLKPGMDTRQVVARFEAERQALAIMDHPSIAKVLDGGATPSGRPYFVMELVKGAPITDYCDENHLSPPQRLELFIPVCQAVQHAHQKGIIHRDLKPSNILVVMHDTTPVPKVIDFGVAKALGQELTDKTLFTGFAQMVGTPLYMSPEQAGQSGLDIDTRSDVYSLGVLLYELLTGTTPFDKQRFKQAAYDEIRRIIREEDPPKPSTRLSSLGSPHAPREDSVTRSVTATLASVAANRHTEPAKLTKLVRGELDWIVMKALEKDRGRRYETANGFAMDVQRYLADEPVAAGPPSVGYRLRKFVRRNKGPVLASSVIFLLLIGGIIGTTWQAVRATRAQGLADMHANDAKEKAALARAESKRASDKSRESEANARLAYRRAYNADMLLAALAWRDSRLGRLRELLDSTRPAQTGGVDYRGFEWHYWDRRCHDDLLTIDIREFLEGLSSSVEHVAFSPDGTQLAIVGNGRPIVWDLPNHRELHRLEGRTAPEGPYRSFSNLAFSPDGMLLAAGDDEGRVQLWDALTGRPQQAFKGHAHRVQCVAFSPDGKWLASGGGQYEPAAGELLVWDISTGKATLRITGLTSEVFSLAFSPDSKRLAATLDRKKLRVWDLPSGREALRIDGMGNPWRSVAFSPDGKIIACAHDNGVTLWDASTGRERASITDLRNGAIALAFCPVREDSVDSIVVAREDRTVQAWRWYEKWKAPELETTYKGHASAVTAVAFSPDGRRVASASKDGTVKLWDAPQDNAWHRYNELSLEHPSYWPYGGPSRLSSILIPRAFTPDGKQLVCFGKSEGTSAEEASALATEHWLVHLDLASRTIVKSLNVPTKVPMKDVFHLAYDRDGRLLALAGEELEGWIPPRRKEVKVLNLPTGEELLVVNGLPEGVSNVVLNHDGSRLAGALERKDGQPTIKVWDLATKQEVFALQSDADGLALSPDGRWLAWISHAFHGDEDANFFLRIADLSGTAAPSAVPVKGLTGLSWAGSLLRFSPNGRRLATAAGDEVVVWDFPSCLQLSVFKGHLTEDDVTFTFSPDANRVASCGSDNVLRLWDPVTGHEVFSGGHAHDPKLDFSADGQWLAIGGDVVDGRPWDEPERILREARSVHDHYVRQPLTLRDELLAAIRRDRTISQDARRAALLLAEQQEERAYELASAAAAYAARPHASAAEYALGLRHAEAACRREPHKPECLAALGACHYRAGQYQNAIDSLTRAERSRALEWELVGRDLGMLFLARPLQLPLVLLDYTPPDDLAFLAMSYHRLGRKDQAAATLARLRSIAEKEPWYEKLYSRGLIGDPLLREAEELIEGKGAAAPK